MERKLFGVEFVILHEKLGTMQSCSIEANLEYGKMGFLCILLILKNEHREIICRRCKNKDFTL